MSRLLRELKTRARLRLNASRRDPGAAPPSSDARLRDCLHAVSREVGFAHWEHARHVLQGLAFAGEDQGSFWHPPRCSTLLSPWFARHEDAAQALAQDATRVLLPYRRQYVLAGDDFLLELGLDPDSPLWTDAGRDLVRAAGRAAWEALAWQRLRATRPLQHTAAAAGPAVP